MINTNGDSFLELTECYDDVPPLERMVVNSVEVIRPSGHIKYPYLLYLPPSVENTVTNLMIWADGSRDSTDIEAQINAVPIPTYIKSYCEHNQVAFLVPILPRTRIGGVNYDAQILSRGTMVVSEDCPEYYRRPDIEILKMLRQVGVSFRENNYQIADKVILTGVSAGGSLVNRFSILYPDLVRAVAIMLAGDSYPDSVIAGQRLGYPFGTADIGLINGQRFSIDDYRKIKHFIYAGALDTDPKYNPLSHDLNDDRQIIERLRPILGENQLAMTRRFVKRLEDLGMDITYLELEDLHHQVDGRVFRAVSRFINNVIYE